MGVSGTRPFSRTTRVVNGATGTVAVILVLLLAGALAISFLDSGRGQPSEPLPAGREIVPTPLGASKPIGLEIPSIDVRSGPVKELGLNEDKSLEVPKDARTIGWYDRGAVPGQDGPAVFASHVNYRGEEGGFADLAKVEPNDQVLVRRADGITAVFIVDRTDRVPKNQFPTATVYGPTLRPELRLITCGGAFDSAAHHYEDNVVVYGHLVEAFRPR